MDDRFGEITALKSLLNTTDYRVIKSAEELLTCTSITELLGKLAGLSTEIRDTIRRRAEWRKKINELEADMEANPAEDDPLTGS